MVSCRLCGLSLKFDVEPEDTREKLLSLWRTLFVVPPGEQDKQLSISG